jgi:hypothetical protein
MWSEKAQLGRVSRGPQVAIDGIRASFAPVFLSGQKARLDDVVEHNGG